MHKPLEPRKCARPACETMFRPKIAKRKYCCVACSHWAKGQSQRGKPSNHHSHEFTKETGPPITEGLSTVPVCHCGRRTNPGTDWLGRTILECLTCGPQRVEIIGEHKYDQRERHQVELEQFISRGKTRVEKPVSWKVGRAFRQKGIAQFLRKPEAA